MLSVTASVLRDLGWARVLERLASETLTDPGRDAALGLGFLKSAEAVRMALARTAELRSLAEAEGSAPLEGLEDVHAVVGLCVRDGVASAADLLSVSGALRAVSRTGRYLENHRERLPSLEGLRERWPDLSALAAELGATFDEAGDIRDDASPELADARRRRGELHQGIKARLERYLQRPEIQEVAQDLFYTQRDDRFVIPVVSSFQGRMPGIIHGTSNTGQTVFVEPEDFVEANNGVKMAEAEVRLEEHRVLVSRSQWIREEADQVRGGLSLAVEVDLLQARARFADRFQLEMPEVALAGEMRLLGARNPLLLVRGVEVVANDIHLVDEVSFLVITGPNTGGKTVTLSTVGLLVLMAHAGLPLPLARGSRVILFKEIRALIGDAQDIEQDLSTFSGHMLALQEILDTVGAGSLVLLDEIVTGTDPDGGAALAVASLEALATRGARGLVTTHYQRLKTMGYEDGRFRNASVGVHPETQQPSYVLETGTPGASNPLVVAQRLGFDPDVVKRAKALAVGHEGVAVAIEGLERARADLELERSVAEAEAEAARAEAQRLAAARSALEARSAEALDRLTDQVTSEAKAALAAIRAQVRDVQQERDPRALERRRRTVLAEEARIRAQGEPPSPSPSTPISEGATALSEAPALGTVVQVLTMGRTGEVVELRGDGSVVVALGSMKVACELKSLGAVVAPAKAPSSPPAPQVQTVLTDQQDEGDAPPQMSTNTCDLRGVRRHEVAESLGATLDRAFRDGHRAYWVIHGMGTGAVRQEVRSLLATLPYVRSWRPGRRGEGDDGITLVWLDTD